MRRDDLTLAEFGPLFRRLMFAYQRLIPAKELEDTIAVYFDTLRRFSEPVVSQAVERLCREPGRFFPKTGDLYRLCADLEGAATRRLGQQHHVSLEHRCGECGKEFWVAGYECGNGAVVGRLRCACRQAGVGWDTPAAQAYTDRAPVVTPALKQAVTAPSTTRAPRRSPEDVRRLFHAVRADAAPLPDGPPPDLSDDWEEVLV